jgi:hypothetical protein
LKSSLQNKSNGGYLMKKNNFLHHGVAIIILLSYLGFFTIRTYASSTLTDGSSDVSLGTIRYVKPDGVNTGTCSTWVTACNLKYALGIAVSGDEIWVTEGTYYPTTTIDRSATFALKRGVEIYGGFPKDGGSWEQRDWEVYSSVLSGDTGIRGDIYDNSYHVVTGSGTDASAILDGFKITSGSACCRDRDELSTPNDSGAGMYNLNGNPTITNIIFYNNYALDGGGGMYNNHSNPRLNNVTFSENSGHYNAGGMHNINSNPTLMNVIFENNSGWYGSGGLSNNESNPLLVNVVFHANSTNWMGGGMGNYNSNPSLVNVTFSQNEVGFFGGGMVNNNSDPSLTNVTFYRNTANMYGGALANGSSDPKLTNVTFHQNQANEDGGAIHNVSSSPTLSNVTIIGNTTNTRGGGLFNDPDSSPTLINCILWDNIAPLGPEIYGPAIVTYSDIEGILFPGVGNINLFPVLGTLADNGGFTLTFAIGENSPAVDAGSPTICPGTDQRSLWRPVDGDGDGEPRCDMGSYEYQANYQPLRFFLPLAIR